MKFTKSTKSTKSTNKEKIVALLNESVSKLFDREPNGSLQPEEVAKLAEKLEKLV